MDETGFTFNTMDELYDGLKRLGLGELGEDNDGQLIIYTGVKAVPSKWPNQRVEVMGEEA